MHKNAASILHELREVSKIREHLVSMILPKFKSALNCGRNRDDVIVYDWEKSSLDPDVYYRVIREFGLCCDAEMDQYLRILPGEGLWEGDIRSHCKPEDDFSELIREIIDDFSVGAFRNACRGADGFSLVIEFESQMACQVAFKMMQLGFTTSMGNANNGMIRVTIS